MSGQGRIRSRLMTATQVKLAERRTAQSRHEGDV